MTYPPYAPTDHIAAAPTPPRRRSLVPAIVVAVVLAFVAVGVAGWLWASSGSDTPIADANPPAAAPPAAEAAGDVAPRAADIALTPKIIDRECFGSAGCNVTLRVDMELTAGAPSPGTSWLVVYEISGVEDGPLVGNLTLTGSSYEGEEETVTTSSAKSKITIKAVSVEKA